MLRLLHRLLWSLFIGLILTVWIIQNNSHVEHLITHKLITLLEKEWNVSIDAQSARVNFFTCSIFLHNGKVVDKDHPACHWTFEQTKVHVSPIAYFLKKKIHLYVTINNITLNTSLDNGQLDVVHHITKIVTASSPDIPISVRSVRLNNFDLTLAHQRYPVRLLMTGSFELSKEKKQGQKAKGFEGTVTIDNLDAFVNKKPLLQKMHGTCRLTKDAATKAWVFTLSAHLKEAAFDPVNEYLLTGQWSPDKRVFVLQEKTGKKGQVSCDFLPHNMVHVQGNLPTHLALNISRFFSQLHDPHAICPASTAELGGTCAFNLNISTIAPLTRSFGTVVVDDLVYKGMPIKHVALTLARVEGCQVQAAVTLEQADRRMFEGTLTWDVEHKCGHLRLINPQSIKPFGSTPPTTAHLCWVIKPRNLFATATFKQEGGIEGTYTLVMLNPTTNNYLAFKGSYTFSDDQVTLEGKTPRGDYQVVIPYQPQPYLKQWTYTIDGKKYVDLQTKDPDARVLEGAVQFELIRSFLDQGSRRLVLGNQAVFQVTLDQKDFSHLTGSLSLDGGKIYLPENRNLIEHMASSFELDFARKFFALNDARIDFCKGRIECHKASVLLNDTYGIKMIHVPLVIDNLFVNWKRDFYGFVYGTLLLNKLPDNDLSISGTLVLKKSLLRDNIFSQGTDVMLSGSLGSFILVNEPLKVDVHILSEQPIRARTDTLETYASVDIRVRYMHGQHIAQFPQITGTISLDSGYLKFLHNRLNIEYGKIQFITNQLNDPMIDFIACNRINKYMVTLQATGSLQKPTIILESTPELTEEQIIGLLLVGSENAKLQTDLFAMLEQNLHNIVLGSKEKLPKATTFLETLTRPFKYVQITPDFTDQSGRGGIKGTVSVNVSDQVHAQIQKNFNLQEDFSAQVEYFLADDVSVKGIKDQRGELGAEVEVRLKL
jgi:hypothetical protein